MRSYVAGFRRMSWCSGNPSTEIATRTLGSAIHFDGSSAGERMHRASGKHIAEKKIDALLGVRGLAQPMVEAAEMAGMRAEFVATPEEAALKTLTILSIALAAVAAGAQPKMPPTDMPDTVIPKSGAQQTPETTRTTGENK